jgi:hypothetical protein
MAFSKSHSQIIFASILCFIIIAGAFWYTNSQKFNTEPKNTALNIDSSASTTKDETFFESSDEWKLQFTKSQNENNSSGSTTDNEPETLTNQLGRNFFVNFIALQQKDKLNDDDAIQSVVDNLIYSTALELPIEKTYSILDLKVNKDNSVESFKKYGNDLMQSFSQYGPKEDAFNIAQEALEKNNFSRLTEIDSIINSFEITISILKDIPVPYECSIYHLNLINSLSKAKLVAHNMKKVDTDPTLSLYALNDYIVSREDTREALIKIKETIISKGVIYTPLEPGILFSTII